MNARLNIQREFLRRKEKSHRETRLQMQIKAKADLENALAQVPRQVFFSLMREMYPFMPSWVANIVAPGGDYFEFLKLVGLVSDHCYFVDIERMEELFVATGPFGPKPWRVESTVTMDSKEFSSLASALDKTLNTKQEMEVIPHGFFVFTYTSQWAAGGEEGEKTKRLQVIQADSEEHAVQQLFSSRYGHDNCFDDFRINAGDGWKRVLVRRRDGKVDTFFSSMVGAKEFFVEK